MHVVYIYLLLTFLFLQFAKLLIIIFIRLLSLIGIVRGSHSNTKLFYFQNLSTIFLFLYLNWRILILFIFNINILIFFINLLLNLGEISLVWNRWCVFGSRCRVYFRIKNNMRDNIYLDRTFTEYLILCIHLILGRLYSFFILLILI